MATTAPVSRQVNIYVNQASAEAAYDKLEKKAKSLQQAIDKGATSTKDFTKELEKVDSLTSKVEGLRKKAADLTAQIEKGTAAGKDMTKQVEALASTNTRIETLSNKAATLQQAIEKGKNSGSGMVKELAQLAKVNGQMETLRKQIDTGMTPAMRQVELYAKDLHRELYQMSADAPGYAAKFKAFQEAQTQLAGMKNELKGINEALNEDPPEEKKGILGWLKQFKDEVKTVAIGTIIGNTTQALFEKVTGYFAGIISGNAKLSDSLADISKATGLTDEEVKKLNSSLGKIDTRTKTAELREMAIGLGQIGEAATPEAIANIDKIVVALGDEFGGGAKEITTELGVLRNNLQDIKTGNYGEDVLHIGNALNVLGADGLATAPVVTDIAKRISGTGEQFGLTAGQILGTAATFQELGIEVERGSSAYEKVLKDMTTNTAAFAKVAGMDVTAFAKLVDTDINSALIKVAEGAKQAGSSNIEFGKILKDLGADGSGAGELLAKLASNSDLLTKKIQLASGALLETGSITDEFNKKNTDMAAQLEKLSKSFDKLTSSPLINGFLTGLVNGATIAVKWLGYLSDWVTKSTVAFLAFAAAGVLQTGILLKLKNTILLSVAGTTELTAATIAATIAERAQIVATSALGVVQALVTGNVKKLRQEWLLMTSAMSINPFTAFLLVAGAVILAIKTLSDRTKELTVQQNVELELTNRIQTAAASEISKVQTLVTLIKSQTLSREGQVKAMQDLIALNPKYLGGLTLENIATAEGTELIAKYIVALKQKSEAEATNSYRTELLKKQIDAEQKVNEARKRAASESVSETLFGHTMKDYDDAAAEYKKLGEQIAEVDKKIAEQVNEAVKNSLKAAAANKAEEETLETLKKSLKDLQDAREKIPLTKTKELAENLKKIQDLEKQIAAVDYKKGDAKAAENEAERLERIQTKIKALRADLDAAAADYNNNKDDKQYELEVQKVKDKYAKLILEAKKYVAEVAQLTELERQELDQLFQKQFDDRSAKEYEESLLNLSNYYNKQKQIANTAYADNAISKEQYSARLHQLDTDEANDRAQIAEDYAGTVKKAADAAEAAKTAATTKGVADRKALDEQEQADRIAAAQRAVAVAPVGSEQQLNARKELLQAQNDIELQALKDRYAQQGIIIDDNNAQVQAKEAELNNQLRELDKQYVDNKIQQYEQLSNNLVSILSNYFSVLNNKDQAALSQDKTSNDKKKEQYQRQLDSKQISQTQYNRLVQKLDDDYAKKQQETQAKQLKREKAAGIFSAVISTAAGVARALKDYPFPYNAIVAGIVGAMGAAQIASIASQKTPTYATGRRPVGNGGIADGPSHADGGIKLVNSKTGEVVGEMEGDEAIVSKKAVQNNPEIANALLDSSMYKGGAKINPLVYAMPAQINTAKVNEAVSYTRMYANGGWVSSASTQPANTESTSNYDPEMIAAMNAFTQGLKNPQKVNFVWTDFLEMQRQYNQVTKAGSMGAGG